MHLVSGVLLAAGVLLAPVEVEAIELRFRPDPALPDYGRLTVIGLPAAIVDRIGALDLDRATWESTLRESTPIAA